MIVHNPKNFIVIIRTMFLGILYYYFFALLQSVLAAVFSSVFGSKDPEQVNTMAKQAGEVSIEY